MSPVAGNDALFAADELSLAARNVLNDFHKAGIVSKSLVDLSEAFCQYMKATLESTPKEGPGASEAGTPVTSVPGPPFRANSSRGGG